MRIRKTVGGVLSNVTSILHSSTVLYAGPKQEMYEMRICIFPERLLMPVSIYLTGQKYKVILIRPKVVMCCSS